MMMRRFWLSYFACIWSLFYWVPLQAASSSVTQTKTHLLSFSVGLKELTLRDQGRSPFIYFGRSLWTLGLYYEQHNPHSFFGFETRASYGNFGAKYHPNRYIVLSAKGLDDNLSSNIIPLDAQLATAWLHTYYLRQLALPIGNKWSIHLGGGLSDELLYPVDNFISENPMNLAHITLQSRIQYQLAAQHRLQLRSQAALLAVVSREPYDGSFSQPEKTLVESFFTKGTRFYTINKYQQFDLAFNYQYHPRGSFIYALGSDWTFQHLATHHSLRMLTKYHHLSIGYEF